MFPRLGNSHLLLLGILSLLLGLWGVRWCVPSQGRLSRVLSPEALAPAFQAQLVSSWNTMYAEFGEEPAINPKIWGRAVTGIVSVPGGWRLPPSILMNSARSFFLRSGQDDEAPVLVALSRVKPWRGQINPRIYNYGGIFMYLLGAWIALVMLLTRHVLASSLAFYISHPAQLAWMYISGRLFSVLHYVVSGFVVYFLGASFWDAETGLWAALLFCVSPGIVLQAHTIKPHLLGALFVMLTFYFCAELLRRENRRSWLFAGGMVGGAAGTAPYFGLVAGLVPIAFCLQLWEKGKRKEAFAAGLKNMWVAASMAVLVFLATNPFFIYQFHTSFKGLMAMGVSASRDFSFIWKFPLFGFRQGTTTPIALLVLFGMVSKNNFRDRIRLLTLCAFIYYFFQSWMLQGAKSLSLTRNYPAFFLGFLLAGCWISEGVREASKSWQKWAIRGLAGACVAYACLTSAVMDYNLHLDAVDRSTRDFAGEWIERNIPEGSELGFFRLPQPSGGVYFHWNRYRLVFIEPKALNESPRDRLPNYLILTCPAYDERAAAGTALDKHYVKLKSFEQFGLWGIRLPVGEIYGNPLIEIYSRRPLH